MRARPAWALVLAAAAAAAAACGPRPAAKEPGRPAGGALTPAQIAERAGPSIVEIRTPTAMGTGFIVWRDGRIATNLHVIAGQREAIVVTADGRQFKDLEVLAADEAHDLAIVRIRGQRDLPALPLGDSGAMKAGDHVVAVGHPMGLGTTVSDGLVSAVRTERNLTLLQITAPISAGSSGGPLLNDRGEVIGVATGFASEGQNLNFAVPVAYLKPLLLAEKAVSLAAFARRMDTGLLEGCAPDEAKLAFESLHDAIGVGAPLYNSGDHQGCYDVYERTALDLVAKLRACRGVEDTLLAGLAASNHRDTASDKAWAMRHAFDRIIDAIVQALEAAQPKP